ncbi:hypothetical protein [Candidatus Bathycorpusculum sp.]|jgi:hypothetical protein|uniref:hypothetical protein n=1 Tax=Candidatus Bathycorpusculum sp. TaxID=2994959 RepID=UPI00282FED7C|nr:hypothetical protein [Candidatus Termitimicrobium sp.]MCL2685244.1 hypothetical protein [Candidatus Termitimicrobium sp.]
MTEQEQRTTEVLDRTTQIKIVKLYTELRINIAGFFGCFIGTIASIILVLQILSINIWGVNSTNLGVVFGIAGLLCGYGAYSFIGKLKVTRKKINELT